jgi:hypothetical protein
MTSDEFVVMGIWILRILIYGFLGALAIGILWVTLRTLNNSLRSRGIMGLILCLFQIAIIVCIVLVGLYYANQTGILQTVIAWLP